MKINISGYTSDGTYIKGKLDIGELYPFTPDHLIHRLEKLGITRIKDKRI